MIKRLKRAWKAFWNEPMWFDISSEVCEFVLPLLKRFRNETIGIPQFFENKYPGLDRGYDKWIEVVDHMIKAFELTVDPDRYKIDFKSSIGKQSEEYRLEGIRLFAKHFDDLWD